MKKTILSAVALILFAATAALAQTTPVKMEDGGDKTKQTVDGMTVKTKVDPKDGKMKVKGKDDMGNSIKSTTTPRTKDERKDYRESRMKTREARMDRKGMKMDHKGMKKDMPMQPAATPGM